jgi:hypothetical protein
MAFKNASQFRMSNIDPIAIWSSFDIQRSIFDIKSLKLVTFLSRREPSSQANFL